MNNQRVLIIDDDPGLVRALESRCAALGLDVATAHDAVEGLAIARERVPELILLDIHMPSGSGLGVCELLATSEQLRSVPVVVMTGDPEERAEIRAKSLGARFVRKGEGMWMKLERVLRRDLGLGQAGAVRDRAAAC